MPVKIRPLEKQVFSNRGTARQELLKLTLAICKMIRDDYGHYDDVVYEHMRNVITFCKVPGAGSVLASTYQEYLLPHMAKIFERDASFFKSIDVTEYVSSSSDDATYVSYIFDAFAKCYDKMTDEDTKGLWDGFQNIVLICNAFSDI